MITGHRLPGVQCPRGYDDCKSLSQLISDQKASFVCCGHSIAESRDIQQDRFRVCWKGPHTDEMGDYDERDLKTTIAVMAQALMIDHDMRLNNGEISE